MSIPRKHHYLPRFYLDRWTVNGQVIRYVRPRGPDGKLHWEAKYPGAIGYEPDLYKLPDVADAESSQILEKAFFQKIDSRAAVALQKLDCAEPRTTEDAVALSQFVISLLHRSPSRLKAIREELRERSLTEALASAATDDIEQALQSTTNRLLGMLVESPKVAKLISTFKVFRIDLDNASKRLLTSDRPVTMSAQMISSDAFLIMPYGPKRLMMLTHEEKIVRAFTTQEPNTLVRAINQATIEQAEDVVIASDQRATRLIERHFQRHDSKLARDSIGTVRRRSPLESVRPTARAFSRHDKRGMGYLGG